ncbi:MAG TPA: PilN domain-containing protein [Candidatus Angelobacter sp.]|jgi:Tfp pilus assembly protein PilN|nr:PilN domain-containing protein [Candidatus Angelobacter sp.]
MIRINLLGIPKTKRGKRAAAPSLPSEGPSPVFLGLIMFLATGLILGYLYLQVHKEHDRLETALQDANRENARLSPVKADYERTKKESEQFQRRLNVIEQLQNARVGPVDFMNKIANTINSTDAIWLQAITDDGRITSFTGMALSPNAVADLMVNLQKTGLFKTVEIKETSQDSTIKEMQAYKFELNCEKVPGQLQPQAPAQTKPDTTKKA